MAAALDGLPSFKFTGDPKLSKNLDARIQETEEVRVDVGGHYYATLAGWRVFWIVWLLLLIFYGRPSARRGRRRAARADARRDAARLPRPARSRHARCRGQGEAGDAPAAPLARRTRRSADVPMSAALEAIGRSEKTGEPLRQLQHWLHHPRFDCSRARKSPPSLTPYTVEPPKPAPAASQP